MWAWIEPEIESVRRRLAGNFGCDPEEMAITRNASEALETVQLGIPPERGDEVLTTTQDYPRMRSEEHTSELQSQSNLVCRLLLEKKKQAQGPRRQGHLEAQGATGA